MPCGAAAFQSFIPLRSVCLSVSGAVALSRPASRDAGPSGRVRLNRRDGRAAQGEVNEGSGDERHRPAARRSSVIDAAIMPTVTSTTIAASAPEFHPLDHRHPGDGAMQGDCLDTRRDRGAPFRYAGRLQKGPGRHAMTRLVKPVAGALALAFATICGASAQEVKQDVDTKTTKPANITPVSQAMLDKAAGDSANFLHTRSEEDTSNSTHTDISRMPS